jgi:hypothetical protein
MPKAAAAPVAKKPETAPTPAAVAKKKVPSASGASKPAASVKPGVSAEERYRMIQEAAYHRAEQRGFQGGDPHEDWVAAEAEIDAMLAARTG